MGALRTICCLLILYSVITLFITTENIIEDNHLYLMLKHSIMVVLSIILFAYSFFLNLIYQTIHKLLIIYF
jgi:hypothetical protein